jgi:ABC-type uncharacterized transport system auxiliary subunit
MKRLFLVPLLCLSLGGCLTLQGIETAYQVGTVSITNPVTRDRLYTMEQAVKLTFIGLNTWKKLCVQGQINVNCKQQVRTVQVYTASVPLYLKQLRAFVANNDQINAIVVFNQLSDLIATVKTQAVAGGATFQGA